MIHSFILVSNSLSFFLSLVAYGLALFLPCTAVIIIGRNRGGHGHYVNFILLSSGIAFPHRIFGHISKVFGFFPILYSRRKTRRKNII